MKRISLFLLLLTASVFSSAQDFSNKGKDFWLGYGYHVRYVTNGGGGGANGQEMVLYFATENKPGQVTNIKIEIPALGYVENLTNVAFLRTQILLIENFFETGEADEIWLTFPDPRPRKIDVRRRLTNSRFLVMYKNLLKPEGYFRFKTDNTGLFEYTLEEIQNRSDIVDLKFTSDLYESDLRGECFDIKTKYEEMFATKGEKIKYLRCRFKTDH